MGEGRTGEPKANHERLTVAEAAVVLGITEGAVRSRIKRGTLQTTKEGGTVFVQLGGGTPQANQTTNTGVPSDQIALIEALRDQIEDLRQERDEWREQARITDRLLSVAMERIPAIEAPQEASDAETVEEAPDRSEPHPATGGAQEGTERSQLRNGWRAPVDKLPWWHYVLGLVLVGLASYLSSLVLSNFLPASVFGLWVGFRRRHLRFRSQVIPFGILVGLAIVLGDTATSPLREWVSAYERFSVADFAALLLGYMSSTLGAGWLFYVSGALVGSAWQRRRTERLSGTTPAAPMASANLASPGSRTASWTPRQQAILGFVGTLIAALISLMGAILTALVGSGS